MLNKLLFVSIINLLLFFHLSASAATFDESLLSLQKQWAIANYQSENGQLEQLFKDLTEKSEKLMQEFPERAEPLIWKAIILSSDAGKNGGFSALSKVKQARELLLKAEKINPSALSGSIYTSLGSLYYQVPGWPIGFGDDEMAEKYLLKALEINPEGIDPNFFYGDYLFEQKKYTEAKKYFNQALKAKNRTNRPIADQGRRDEIKQKLKSLDKELKG